MSTLNQHTRALSIGALVLAMFAMAVGPAFARGGPEPSQPPATVTALGEGEIVVQPDRAIITVGVQLYNQSVQDGAAELRDRMDAVVAAVRDLGIPEEKMQTTNYSIFFERDYQSPISSMPSPPVGLEGGRPAGAYRVENMVRVTIDDVTRAASVVDAAVAAGANQMYGIEFTLSSPGQYDSQVREEAVRNARARAESLAAAAGRELGDAIEVTEIIGGSGGVPMYEARAMGMGGGVQPGGLVYTARVQVTFALLPTEP